MKVISIILLNLKESSSRLSVWKRMQTDICKNVVFVQRSKLQKWIKKYNGHEELKSSGTERKYYHDQEEKPH